MLCSSHAFHNYFCVTIKKSIFTTSIKYKALADTFLQAYVQVRTFHKPYKLCYCTKSPEKKELHKVYVNIVQCFEACHHDDNCSM